jgi:hypothetical protein
MARAGIFSCKSEEIRVGLRADESRVSGEMEIQARGGDFIIWGTKAEITSCYSGDLHSDLADFHQWTNKIHKTEMTWNFSLIQRKSTMAHMYTHELRETPSQHSTLTLETRCIKTGASPR